MMQDEERVEQLDKKIIDTRINVEPKGLAREKIDTSRMKNVEVVMYSDNKIEISFLEMAGYYAKMTYKLIKLIYPILPAIITIAFWIDGLKNKKEVN